MVVSALQGIRDEIASRLNEVESDNTDTYTTWVNLGLRDIQNSFPQTPFLQTSADRTLSSGTRIYTNLPSDFDKMNTVVYPAGNATLAYVSPEEFDMLSPSATAGGSPKWYTIRGRETAAPRIEFYPTPGSSLTVHYDYQALMDVVSASSATPGIPVRYFELLVMFGEMTGLKRKGLRDDARTVAVEYETLKQKMIQDLQREVTTNKRIRSDRDFLNASRYSPDPVINVFEALN
jgi:hypothetical protein